MLTVGRLERYTNLGLKMHSRMYFLLSISVAKSYHNLTYILRQIKYINEKNTLVENNKLDR